MTFPIEAVEACEALSHPLPHPPDMHERSIDVSHASHCERDPSRANADAAELEARIDHWFRTKYAGPVACGLLPTSSNDTLPAANMTQAEGGAQIDTMHPGPIAMLEAPGPFKRFIRRHSAALVGAFVAMALCSVGLYLTS